MRFVPGRPPAASGRSATMHRESGRPPSRAPLRLLECENVAVSAGAVRRRPESRLISRRPTWLPTEPGNSNTTIGHHHFTVDLVAPSPRISRAACAEFGVTSPASAALLTLPGTACASSSSEPVDRFVAAAGCAMAGSTGGAVDLRLLARRPPAAVPEVAPAVQQRRGLFRRRQFRHVRHKDRDISDPLPVRQVLAPDEHVIRVRQGRERVFQFLETERSYSSRLICVVPNIRRRQFC